MSIGKWISVGIIVLLTSLVLFMGYNLYGPKTTYASKVVSGNAIFQGKITNMKVAPGNINGISAYDSNCVGNVITECDAGINTAEYGLLNFHYSHEMSKQPCIHMFGPEKLVVEILDSDGNAKVIRTQDFSGMNHHG